jgi:hypothetical protein
MIVERLTQHSAAPYLSLPLSIHPHRFNRFFAVVVFCVTTCLPAPTDAMVPISRDRLHTKFYFILMWSNFANNLDSVHGGQ